MVSDCWLWDDGLVDSWDERLSNDLWLSDLQDVLAMGNSFLADNCVESMDGISGVIDNTLGAIRFNQWVLSLNDISITWFSLWFSITGQTIMDVIWEWVLRVWIVVIDALDECWWQSLLDGDGWLGMVSMDSGLMVSNSSWLMVDSGLSVCKGRLRNDSSTSNSDDSAESNELKEQKNCKNLNSKAKSEIYFECHF